MLIFLFIFFGGNLSALEEPSYTIIKKYDDFEIRDYEPYMVAEVDINGTYQNSGNSAFR